MTEIEAVWQKNIDDLHSGVFGSNLNSPKTILAYWKAQAESKYPKAEENVRYWTDIVEKSKRENR